MLIIIRLHKGSWPGREGKRGEGREGKGCEYVAMCVHTRERESMFSLCKQPKRNLNL